MLRGLSVLFVGHTANCAKMAEPAEMPFEVQACGPKESFIR